MKFKLSKYIIPAVISMVLVGTYTNIDGLFIGNITGDDGLAAINIAWPIVAFITSVGTGIGVGGSVMINDMRGKGKTAEAENLKRTTIALLAISGIVVTALSMIVYKPLLKAMGAEDKVFTHACNYALVISAGAFLQVAGAGLVVLLRNDGKTIASMLYTALGLIVHIALDFCTVKKYELYGVAVSTVVSQGVVLVCCFISLKIKSKRTDESGGEIPPKLSFRGVKEILSASVAPFGINFVPSATLLFTNYFALKCGGTAAVSAYAIMSYAVYTFDYVFQGVCDGVQPVISYQNGAGDIPGKKKTIKTAVLLLFALSVVFSALTPAMIAFLPGIFDVSDVAAKMINTGLKIYSLSYVLKASVKFICAYCYSVREKIISDILTYLDPIVFTPFFLFILSSAVGINGVWWSVECAQAAVCVVAAAIFAVKKSRKGI